MGSAANGTNGATGPTGPGGAPGAAGAAGTDLTSQTPFPSGSRSRVLCRHGGDTSGDSAGTAITYEQPLATPIADVSGEYTVTAP
jgi:hypothetical protein